MQMTGLRPRRGAPKSFEDRHELIFHLRQVVGNQRSRTRSISAAPQGKHTTNFASILKQPKNGNQGDYRGLRASIG
jgi:pantothenate kinase